VVDKIALTIDLTPEESQQIEAAARQQGYETSAAYVHALVTDAIAQYDFDTKDGILAGLHESWQQAMTGQTRPISELWDALDDE
jgi:hypothetical protein